MERVKAHDLDVLVAPRAVGQRVVRDGLPYPFARGVDQHNPLPGRQAVSCAVGENVWIIAPDGQRREFFTVDGNPKGFYDHTFLGKGRDIRRVGAQKTVKGRAEVVAVYQDL